MNISDRLKDVAISDSGILFDPYTGLTFTVNPTGRSVLQRMREGMGPDEIVATLGVDFDVADQDDVQRDVREFLLVLKESGLIPRGLEDEA
jgi:PqqD family protein of HPr-rel-A system